MEQDQMSGPAPQSRFNLWLIATIVLAVFLIAGGVVFAWQKSVGDKAKSDLQGQINTLQNQMQQLTKTNADQTAPAPTAKPNWTSYKTVLSDGAYDVAGVASFEYPNNWFVATSPLSNCGADCKNLVNVELMNHFYFPNVPDISVSDSYCNLRIFQYSSPSPLTIKAWIEQSDIPASDKKTRITAIKKITIAGAERDAWVSEVDWQKGIAFADGNKIYDFTCSVGDSAPGSADRFTEEAKIFDRIMTSLDINSLNE